MHRTFGVLGTLTKCLLLPKQRQFQSQSTRPPLCPNPCLHQLCPRVARLLKLRNRYQLCTPSLRPRLRCNQAVCCLQEVPAGLSSPNLHLGEHQMNHTKLIDDQQEKPQSVEGSFLRRGSTCGCSRAQAGAAGGWQRFEQPITLRATTKENSQSFTESARFQPKSAKFEVHIFIVISWR